MAGDADGSVSACPKKSTHPHPHRHDHSSVFNTCRYIPCAYMYNSSRKWNCLDFQWFIFLLCDKNCRWNGMQQPTDNLDPVCVSLCFMNILIQIQLSIQAPGQAADNNTVSLGVMLSLRSQTGIHSEWNHYESCLLWLRGIGARQQTTLQDQKFFSTRSDMKMNFEIQIICCGLWIIRRLYSTAVQCIIMHSKSWAEPFNVCCIKRLIRIKPELRLCATVIRFKGN